MNSVEGLILWGAVVIVVFDACASLVSLTSGIPYGWFTIGSVTVYIAVGYVGSLHFSRGPAVAAATAVAGAEATFGLAISVIIGPGRMDPALGLSAGGYILMSVLVTLPVGAFCGWIGSVFGGRAARA